MPNILITGVQGAGKTTITAALAERGYPILDSDDISGWVNKNGVPLTSPRPVNPTAAWLHSHEWVWDQAKLHDYLNQSTADPVLLCGISWDQDQHYNLFDKVILLEADKPTIHHRLLTRSNGNPFGKMPHELQFILEKLGPFQQTAKAAGAISVDARQPLEMVTREIICAISRVAVIV
jgi:dephospho-CoA kinase